MESGEQEKSRGASWWASLPQERKAEHYAKQNHRRCKATRGQSWWAELSPERKAEYAAQAKARREARTPEQKAERTERVRERARAFKRMCMEYKGGCCQSCGLVDVPEVFDLHHVDPSAKEFQFSRKAYYNSLTPAVRAELDKCELLCANCHRRAHARPLGNSATTEQDDKISAMESKLALWGQLNRAIEERGA